MAAPALSGVRLVATTLPGMAGAPLTDDVTVPGRRVHAGLSIRPFDRDRDTVELVLMWRASFEHGVGVIDPHPLAEQTAFLLDQVVPSHRIVVAHDESGTAGFLAATDESVGQLYVRVDRIGEGIGSGLLGCAKRESLGRLWLYTFARNHRALAFYARHGFVEVARGFEPTWQLEDVRMQWTRPVSPA
jgi:GNAT superfamily N-acetyltransferase